MDCGQASGKQSDRLKRGTESLRSLGGGELWVPRFGLTCDHFTSRRELWVSRFRPDFDFDLITRGQINCGQTSGKESERFRWRTESLRALGGGNCGCPGFFPSPVRGNCGCPGVVGIAYPGVREVGAGSLSPHEFLFGNALAFGSLDLSISTLPLLIDNVHVKFNPFG